MSLFSSLLNSKFIELTLQTYNKISKGDGFILAYHEITVEQFDRHLQILGKNRIISLQEFIFRKNNGKSLKNLFCITVDDCYKNTLPELCQYATKHHIPITFFVPTDFIDGKLLPPFIFNNLKKISQGLELEINGLAYDFTDKGVFNDFFNNLHDTMYYKSEKEYLPIWNEIEKSLVSNYNIEVEHYNPLKDPVSWDFIQVNSANDLFNFQSHGVTHQAVVGLNKDELISECLESKRRIQEITNKEVDLFCYPYGGNKNIGNEAEAIISKHFKAAVTMNRSRVKNNNSNYLLPRIDLYEKDSPSRALLKTLIKG